jgi:glycosyltransferase involved in cell wall biosynthesis
MNYCVIAYTIYKADNRVRRYAETLASQGGRVDVISAKQSRSDKAHEVINGVNVHRVSLKANNVSRYANVCFGVMLFFLVGSATLIFKHLRYKYRVIHINNMPNLLIFMGVVPKLLGAKLILDIHDIVPEYFCRKYGKSVRSRVARLFLFFERISVRLADYVIVANDIWREKIAARNGIDDDRCTTLLNYPELKYFVPHQKFGCNGQLRIVYPGTMSHLHGTDIAIKAIGLVKKVVPEVKLDIYAARLGMSYHRYLSALVDTLDLGQNVEFFGVVPMEELSRILSRSDIGVVPKRDGIFASEAFSTKTLEFMAAGVPIIVSETLIDRYYFDESMLMFFKPDDHEGLARCILELKSNQDKANSLTERGLKFIKANNWDRKKSIYEAIINKLTGVGPKGPEFNRGDGPTQKIYAETINSEEMDQ